MTTTTPARHAKVRPMSRAEQDRLGRELDQLMTAQAAAEARIDEIKERFRLALEFGNHVAGDLKVSIQHNVTRDTKALEADFPFEEYPDLYKAVLDTKVVNHELAPVVLEKYRVEGAPKVVVTRFEDDK